MKIIRRNKVFVWLPTAILGILGLNLTWDLIKINLDSEVIRQWPWRLNLLDVPTSATLVGIIAGLLLARAQFSKSMSPAIGWWGYEVKKSTHIPDAAWSVYLHNYGPGNCRVTKVQYSYSLTDHPDSGWKTWDEVLEELASVGIRRSRDYHLRGIGVGAIFPVDSSSRDETELAAFTKDCLTKLSTMDVALEVEDALGDIYGRTIRCLHTAHKITGFRYVNAMKKTHLRRSP
jgi:hypothetical protein